MTSITVKKLRHAQQVRASREREEAQEKQLKHARDIAKDIEKGYRAEFDIWKRKPENKVRRNKRFVMATFQEFLKATNKEDYVPFDENHSLWVPPKSQKFWVDAPVRHLPVVNRPLLEIEPLFEEGGIRISIGKEVLVLSSSEDEDTPEFLKKNNTPLPPLKEGESPWSTMKPILTRWKEYQSMTCTPTEWKKREEAAKKKRLRDAAAQEDKDGPLLPQNTPCPAPRPATPDQIVVAVESVKYETSEDEEDEDVFGPWGGPVEPHNESDESGSDEDELPPPKRQRTELEEEE